MLNRTVFQALAAALRLDPAGAAASALIRRAYANPSPAQPAPEADAVYFHLAPDGDVPPLREDSFDAGFRFAPYRLNLVFYGPRAESLAWQVWHHLYQDGTGSPRCILRGQGIYPVPHPYSPVLVWEEAGKEHRPRADLTIPLRIASLEPALPRPSVSAPPEVRIHRPG